MQVTSLQLGHDQLIMLHFAWVSILLIRAVHKDCVTPPPYGGQWSTCDTNASQYAAFTVKRQLLMFHSTHTIDNTETSDLNFSRYVSSITRHANKVTEEHTKLVFHKPSKLSIFKVHLMTRTESKTA
jgi:hypothetical protein